MSIKHMISLFILFSISAIFLNAQSRNENPVLMPLPRSMELRPGNFKLNAGFTVNIHGPNSGRIAAYSTRCLTRLSDRTGISLVHAFPDTTDALPSAGLTINFIETGRLAVGMDESYQLDIKEDHIILAAKTDIGAMRGLETLLQLIQSNKGYSFPCITIADSPRFTWRGLMIDCSRHFMPIDVLKRNLDGMAAVKLNVFHWHLSDDQGFRVECKTFPALHEIASNGQYYTQEQIKEIIAYAAARGIRVVPEFDIPGHSTSWLAAFPQFGSAPGTGKVESGYGTFDPTFDPTRDSVYLFFDRFFAEMSALFPDDYMHIGGDENNGAQWTANRNIQSFMKEKGIPDNHALQAWFNKRINDILTSHGKKMMGWDEILHPDLPKNIVVQSWRGMNYLADAAKKGYMNILSNGYYIDLLYSAKDHYLVDPCPDSLGLTQEEQTHILGGEATMWSELVTPETIDCRIWPRTAAIAERFWSPASAKDVRDMYKRLPVISYQLSKLGLLHEKNFELHLQQLAGGQDTEPFRVLLTCLSPITGYDRYSFSTYTTATRFNRAVDIASPESAAADGLNFWIDGILIDKQRNVVELVNDLSQLMNNDEKVAALLPKAPLAAELAPASKKVAELAKLGLEAVAKIISDTKADHEWIDMANNILAEADKPVAEMRIRIVEPVRRLVLAVGK